MNQNTIKDLFGDAVFVITRTDLLEDGSLIDLTAMAQEHNLGRLPIKYPVAASPSVCQWIRPSEAEEAMGQSIAGRLWDVFWMLSLAARRSQGNTLSFKVMFLRESALLDGYTFDDQEDGEDLHDFGHVTVTFVATCGPGDNGEPVITILMPGED